MNRSKSRLSAGRSALRRSLNARYGVLMTIGDVAEMFRISPESFGNTLRTSSDPKIQSLRQSKIRFGRRVRFPTDAVVSTLMGSGATENAGNEEGIR